MSSWRRQISAFAAKQKCRERAAILPISGTIIPWVFCCEPPSEALLATAVGDVVGRQRQFLQLSFCSRCKVTHSDVLTVSTSAHFHNLELQKSPSRVFGQNSGNSADISKAFFEMGISKFESSQVSQAVTQLEIVDPRIR